MKSEVTPKADGIKADEAATFGEIFGSKYNRQALVIGEPLGLWGVGIVLELEKGLGSGLR
jgi:hypothetical protein